MLTRAINCLAQSLALACFPGLVWGASGIRIIVAQQPTSRGVLQTDDTTQNLGPYRLIGEKFTVVLRAKRLPETSDRKQMETLSALEIRDHAGAVVYQRTFAYQIVAGKFAHTLTASAKLLPATNGNGLLITYREGSPAEPSTTYWQVFGFINGKLGLFSGPASGEAPAATGMLMGSAVRGGGLGMPMAQQGDRVELRLWTGNFYVIVPILVDWRHAHVLPAEHCFESGAGAGLRERGCDLRVEARRSTSQSDLGFVRLFREPQESEAGAKHVVVKPDSPVEYLAARDVIRWTSNGDLVQASFPDLWLKVLIDNDDEKEGWIHSEGEFRAVGLTGADSEP